MRLSKKTVEVCKLTAPVITKHSDIVSEKLYEKLYKNYPKTKTIFGSNIQEQSYHFKSVIAVCAENIDTLETLPNNQSVLKNTTYHSIVKISLLQAIEDVFGDAATKEVINAWEEVYNFLDDIVITNEKALKAS